jgi:RNA polymerase sigma-B factor
LLNRAADAVCWIAVNCSSTRIPSGATPWGTRERWLFARARAHGDSRARDQLFEQMMPLARRLAHQFRDSTEPLDDLLQVASLALLGALERFDPDRGVAFHTYAIPTITGALKRYRRDLCWSVRVPRYLQERSLRVRRELRLLSCELARHPTLAELAARCALSEDEVLEARIAGAAYRAVALDDDDLALAPPAMAGEDPALRRVEEREALAHALRALPKRERRILTLRFEHDLTHAEIASRVGLSRRGVGRLLAQALNQIGVVLAHPR